MSSNEDLKYNLSALSNEELVYRVSSSMLTIEAHQIALHILTARGVNTGELIKSPNDHIQEFKAYSSESKDEKRVSNRSFFNLFLAYFCPLLTCGIGVLSSDALKIQSQPLGTIALLATFALQILVLWLLYWQLFKKLDRLSFGGKVAGFSSAVLIALFFSIGTILQKFGVISA